MRYFREKLNRRNVTVDVKHYEDCEQLFLSLGKCLVVEAFLEFFQMSNTQQKPTRNGPNMAFMTTDEQKKKFIEKTLDKFLEHVCVQEKMSCKSNTSHFKTRFSN
jgi:hypothetical protein